MPYSEPTNLAVVACPGGESFANEVITHLRHMYKHRFSLKSDVISKRYGLEKEKIVQQMNLFNDVNTSDLCIRGSIDKYRPPVFKVNTQFTFFANGELKAELMECIRGKDVFIFQDIENHEEISLNGGKKQAQAFCKRSRYVSSRYNRRCSSGWGKKYYSRSSGISLQSPAQEKEP